MKINYSLKSVRRIIGFSIVFLLFFFMAKSLYQNWNKIPFEKIRFNYYYLAISFIPLLFCFPIGAFAWKYILNNLGEKIFFRRAAGIIAISQLGKYLPGKIWFAVGRIYLAKVGGICGSKTLVSLLLETGMLFISSLILFLISAIGITNLAIPHLLILSAIITIIGLVGLYPTIFSKILNFFLSLFRRKKIEIYFPYGRILLLLIIYGIAWLLYGLGFYLLINSFYPVAFSSLLYLTAVYAISWNIGFIILISPAGLGVREGVLSSLLQSQFPQPITIIIAFLSRIWITIGELIFLIIAVKWGIEVKRYGKEEKAEERKEG